MTKMAQLVNLGNSVGGQLGHGDRFNFIKKLTNDHTWIGGVTPFNTGKGITNGVGGTAVIEPELVQDVTGFLVGKQTVNNMKFLNFFGNQTHSTKGTGSHLGIKSSRLKRSGAGQTYSMKKVKTETVGLVLSIKLPFLNSDEAVIERWWQSTQHSGSNVTMLPQGGGSATDTNHEYVIELNTFVFMSQQPSLNYRLENIGLKGINFRMITYSKRRCCPRDQGLDIQS